MTHEPQSEPRNNQVDADDRKQIIQVLSFEYQMIREEILVRTSGRFQFLGLMTTAAALLTTGIFGSSIFKGKSWIAAALATLVFLFGVICFIYLGRQRDAAWDEVANLEKRINALLPLEPGFSSVLGEVRTRRQWTWRRKLKFLLLGPRTLDNRLDVGSDDLSSRNKLTRSRPRDIRGSR